MVRKFIQISRLERIVLLLTALFIAGTLAYFQWDRTVGATQVETAHAPQTAAAPQTPEAPGILAGEKINLNTASAADLTRLPGIGPTKAASIVAWRTEHGGFQMVEQLTQVKGIGNATLKRLQAYVTVDGDTGTEKGGTPDGENSGGG